MSGFFGYHETVDEIPGIVSVSHCFERPQLVDKGNAMFCGKPPECLVLDDIQADVPGFSANVC
jgi:hypothetical protein